MTPSQQAKAAGCKNLKQVAQHINKPESTLHNWARNYPELFECVCIGVASKLIPNNLLEKQQ